MSPLEALFSAFAPDSLQGKIDGTAVPPMPADAPDPNAPVGTGVLAKRYGFPMTTPTAPSLLPASSLASRPGSSFVPASATAAIQPTEGTVASRINATPVAPRVLPSLLDRLFPPPVLPPVGGIRG